MRLSFLEAEQGVDVLRYALEFWGKLYPLGKQRG